MPARFRIKVKCIETGKAYKSISQASFEEDLEPYLIRQSIKLNKKVSGRTFVKIEERKDE